VHWLGGRQRDRASRPQHEHTVYVAGQSLMISDIATILRLVVMGAKQRVVAA
jgi:hypothetical protein